jgi:hypothetical protein
MCAYARLNESYLYRLTEDVSLHRKCYFYCLLKLGQVHQNLKTKVILKCICKRIRKENQYLQVILMLEARE